jgi:hypothetical protein
MNELQLLINELKKSIERSNELIILSELAIVQNNLILKL